MRALEFIVENRKYKATISFSDATQLILDLLAVDSREAYMKAHKVAAEKKPDKQATVDVKGIG